MNARAKTLDERVVDARSRMDALRARPAPAADAEERLKEQLASALEELSVAAEELDQQNDELMALRQQLVAERDRYRGLFAQAPAGYLVTSPEGIVREANQSAAALLGVAAGFLVGKPLAVFVERADHASLFANLARVAAEPEAVSFEASLVPREARPVRAAIVANAIRGIDGGTAAVRLLLTDLTARDRMLAGPEHSRRLESLATLGGGVAHVFNNLFGIILGHLELAESRLPEGHGVGRHFAEARKALDKAVVVAGKMLALSGCAVVDAREGDLAAEVGRTCEELRASLPAGVELRLHVAASVPAVAFDAGQLRIALGALVANAVEASATRPATVGLRVTERAVTAADEHLWRLSGLPLVPGPHAVVEVEDAGDGMDEAQLDRAVEPFFTTRFPGRGLGLPLVLGIMRGHRGGLSIESEPGRGTRVSLLFTRAR